MIAINEFYIEELNRPITVWVDYNESSEQEQTDVCDGRGPEIEIFRMEDGNGYSLEYTISDEEVEELEQIIYKMELER